MEDSQTTGFLAALAAPFFMSVGFIIWDKIWMNSGGSAFALNLFKCNLATIGFLIAGLIFGFRISDSDGDIGNPSDNEETLGTAIGFLILSGFIGIIVGDLAWLESLRQLGASQVIILDTIKPFSAALFGYIILDESIHWAAYIGIVLTVTGVLIVSLEGERKNTIESEKDNEDTKVKNNNGIDAELEHLSNSDLAEGGKLRGRDNDVNVNVNAIEGIVNEEHQLPPVAIHLKAEQASVDNDTTRYGFPRNKKRGYVLGILNIFLDTYGFVLTKQHGTMFSTWTINAIRFGSSGIAMLALSCILCLTSKGKRKGDTKKASVDDDDNDEQPATSSSPPPWYRLPILDRGSWTKVCIGVLFVTFCCPALSNYAVFQITLGLAMALGSVTPLYALFLEWPVHGEEKRPTLKSIGGACLSIAGVVVLSIFNQ